jgi:hypothetical protein
MSGEQTETGSGIGEVEAEVGVEVGEALGLDEGPGDDAWLGPDELEAVGPIEAADEAHAEEAPPLDEGPSDDAWLGPDELEAVGPIEAADEAHAEEAPPLDEGPADDELESPGEEDLGARLVLLENGETITQDALEQMLKDEWADEYYASVPEAELQEVKTGPGEYGYDRTYDRVMMAFGNSEPTDQARDKARMAGHPLSQVEGEAPVHRGHIFDHKSGGGTDINLVRQDGKLNTSGAWRSLERYSAENPGTFRAIRMQYTGDSQKPDSYDVYIVREGALEKHHFKNG